MPNTFTQEQIQNWFIQKISNELEVPIDEIDIHASITDFGVDSITMVHLTAELGEFIGTDIEPTALYKYHTIEAITGFVYDLSKSSANES